MTRTSSLLLSAEVLLIIVTSVTLKVKDTDGYGRTLAEVFKPGEPAPARTWSGK